MKIKLSALFLGIIISITGCDSSSDKDKASGKPSSGGSTLEMVVVSDDQLWNGIISSKIEDYFGEEQPGLGQAESRFDIKQINFEEFDKMFQKYRNLLILEIDKNKEPNKSIKTDVWASPQFVVKLVAPDKEGLKKLIKEEKDVIRKAFYIAERKNIKNAYKKLNQSNLVKKLEDTMNISMIIPEGFYIAKLKERFVWLRRETKKMSQGVFIYTQPYHDTSQFKPDRILNYRDSVTKKFIPGPLENTYMSTERMFRPFTREISFKDEYATEVRGLWETENYQMGGPFLNITTYDEKNDRLVSMDGFVYHPNKPKRDYLMQLEGLIYTINFTNGEDEKDNEEEKEKEKM